MQPINSSFNPLPLSTNNNVPSGRVQVQKSDDPVAEKQAIGKQDKYSKAEEALASQKQTQQVESNSTQQNQQKQNVELDGATIAFLQNNQEQNQLVQKKETTADFNNSNESIAKDTISTQNQTAVSNYQQIGNLAQRESVQQLLGIDLYA